MTPKQGKKSWCPAPLLSSSCRHNKVDIFTQLSPQRGRCFHVFDLMYIHCVKVCWHIQQSSFYENKTAQSVSMQEQTFKKTLQWMHEAVRSKAWMQWWYHAMTILKTHRHEDGGKKKKKNGWMERGWKREREKFMPSHDDSTEQVKLCGHIASQQLQDLKFLFLLSRQVYLGFSSFSGTRLNLFSLSMDRVWHSLSFSLFFRL